jgi:hypothetical protein
MNKLATLSPIDSVNDQCQKTIRILSIDKHEMMNAKTKIIPTTMESSDFEREIQKWTETTHPIAHL